LPISSLACKADAGSSTTDNTGGRGIAPFHRLWKGQFLGLLPSCAAIVTPSGGSLIAHRHERRMPVADVRRDVEKAMRAFTNEPKAT
jgi:hypothetical protein